MKAIRVGFVQWLIFGALYILFAFLKNKPIDRQLLLYSTIFIIVPIIVEALKTLYIKIVKK